MGALEVHAKGPVELRVVRRGVAFPVPPEPIAPLGGEDGVARGRSRFGDAERRARLGEKLPRAVLVRIADPCRQVGADPRAGADGGEMYGRGPLGEDRREGTGLDRLRHLDPTVQLVEEVRAASGVVLPGVLAVQDHGDDALFAAGRLRDRLEAADEVGRGVRHGPRLVDESDPVGEGVVAEEESRPTLGEVGPMEEPGTIGRLLGLRGPE